MSQKVKSLVVVVKVLTLKAKQRIVYTQRLAKPIKRLGNIIKNLGAEAKFLGISS